METQEQMEVLVPMVRMVLLDLQDSQDLLYVPACDVDTLQTYTMYSPSSS